MAIEPMVHFFRIRRGTHKSNRRWLLPPDVDGDEDPSGIAPAPVVGTMDQRAQYGAAFDASEYLRTLRSLECQPNRLN